MIPIILFMEYQDGMIALVDIKNRNLLIRKVQFFQSIFDVSAFFKCGKFYFLLCKFLDTTKCSTIELSVLFVGIICSVIREY